MIAKSDFAYASGMAKMEKYKHYLLRNDICVFAFLTMKDTKGEITKKTVNYLGSQ